MRKVKTTITTTDLLEKRRILDDQIVEKKKEKEYLDSQNSMVIAEIEDKNSKLKELNDNFDSLISRIEEFLQFHKENSEKSVEFFQEVLGSIDSAFKLLGVLEHKIEEADDKLNEINSRYEAVKREITLESEDMARRRSDLEIYKSRLQKYIDQSGSNIKIIL